MNGKIAAKKRAVLAHGKETEAEKRSFAGRSRIAKKIYRHGTVAI